MNYLLNTSSVLSCFELSVILKSSSVLSTCGLVITEMKQWSVWGSLECHKQRPNSLLVSSPQPSHSKNKMMYLGAAMLEDSETHKLFVTAAATAGRGGAVPSSEGSQCQVGKPRLVRTRNAKYLSYSRMLRQPSCGISVLLPFRRGLLLTRWSEGLKNPILFTFLSRKKWP